jgi:hypothetical protein
MVLHVQKIILFAICLSAMACQRAAEENSSIVISLPPVEKLSASSTCDPCLKFLAVNVSGEGINSTIYAKREHGDFSEENSEISSVIELEVPVGKQRLFQVMAAYSSSSDDIEIKYGSTVVDLSGSTEIPMTISTLGNFEGGHIAGRYLDGLNRGPTGTVNINLVPEPGKRAFTFLKTQIVNGWFDFFASKNIAITYELEGGRTIFSEIKLNDNFTTTMVAGNTQVARIVRPASYYRYNGSSWEQESEDDTDLVIGFFFAPNVSDPNKRVCKQSVTSTFLNLAANSDGTGPLTYDPVGTTGDVLVYGGTSNTVLCPTNPIQQYTQDVIHINGKQFDGMGNDTAKSIQGAFSYFNVVGEIQKYTLAANTFSFRFLPHVFGSGILDLYDGAKLYRSGSEPKDRDNILCNPENLSINGFSEVPSANTFSGTLYSMSMNSSFGSGYAMLCPTKANELRGHGGMYIGLMGNPANLVISGPSTFPTTPQNTTSTANTYTITNTGGFPATAITNGTLSSQFSYGGGTCGATLASGASCIISVTFSPISNMSYTSTISINFHDGETNRVRNFTISGTGSP